MELGPSGVVLSPFWAAVHRRHPDVDLVLLTDEPPPPAADSPVSATDAELTAALDRVAAYASGAWAIATGGDVALRPGLRFGPREHTVVARVQATATLGRSPIAGLADALDEAGWRTARPRSAVDLLVAQRSTVELRASFAPTGALSLTVTSAPLVVGVDRARELVGI